MELKRIKPHNPWSQRKLEEERVGSANSLMVDSYTCNCEKIGVFLVVLRYMVCDN